MNKDGISLPSRMSSGVTAAEVEIDVEGRTKNTAKKQQIKTSCAKTGPVITHVI